MACHHQEDTIVAIVTNGQEAIKIARDEIDDSPREWTNLGVISMCADKSNGEYGGLGEETYHLYGCDDDSDRPGKCGRELFADTLAHLPLFVDNWGWKTVIRTAPNSDDEVPDGYIYATHEGAASMGCISKRTGRPSAVSAKRMLRDEIAAYNQYLASEVYVATLVRTDRCDRGADHETVLEDMHGLYPPYNGNIDEDGRCRYDGWPEQRPGGVPNPADYAVKTFIRDFIYDGEGVGGGDVAEAHGWYSAAAECEDLSDEARAYWAGEARALKAGKASSSAPASAAPKTRSRGRKKGSRT